MASIAQGQPAFRRWIVAKLAIQRQTWPAAPDAELAQWLGVTAEVLAEARELQRGLRTFGDYQKVGIDQRQVRMAMPKPVFLALLELERIRDVPRTTLLRSVVHEVLCRPQLPTHPNYQGGHGWELGGTVYRLERRAAESGKKAHRCDVACYVTTGAFEALGLRASLHRTVPTALMRGALLDLLDGRVTEFETVPSVRYMHSGVEAYMDRWQEMSE